MLRQIHISGLGVIEDLDLELDPGLNVLTGETGAGKTMVTVGLALALGRRASATLVRQGAPAARVQARFDPTPAAVREGWADEDELVLARQVGADGRSTARVGTQLAPVSALGELGAGLVEVHGQHQGLGLLSTTAQTGFLDRSAGPEHQQTLERFAEAYGSLRDLRARLEELERGERERERELDLLAYQIGEIESVDPRSGERDALDAEASRLGHAERLLELAAAAGEALGGEEAGSDALRAGSAALREAAGLDPSARELADRAVALTDEIAELGRDVRAYAERLAVDPGRLEDVRHRLAAFRDLERKYGEGEEEILAFLASARSRREQLAAAGSERQDLAARTTEIEAEVHALAIRVSEGRRTAAPALAAALRAEARELGMEGAEVEVGLVPLPEIGPGGAERVEFGFAGGPGQPLLPLSKVASGGELSRTMLACRSVLVDLDEVPTLVFDEVDQGIGGRAGAAVGRRLARLARSRQVVVVTHLPQIAAFADRHIRVEKQGGTASVDVLGERERVAELSRMLSGLDESDAAATHAQELLAEADKVKAALGSGTRRRTVPAGR